MFRIHMFGFWGIWMFPLVGALLVALIVLLIVRRPRYYEHGPWGGGPERFTKARAAEPALEILNRRYANGEIQKEEYERMKKDILS